MTSKIVYVRNSPSGSVASKVIFMAVSSSVDALISFATGGFKNCKISLSKSGIVALIPSELYRASKLDRTCDISNPCVLEIRVSIKLVLSSVPSLEISVLIFAKSSDIWPVDKSPWIIAEIANNFALAAPPWLMSNNSDSGTFALE